MNAEFEVVDDRRPELLSGLPAPAFELVLKHLVASGSTRLVELLQCSRVTRELVLQHTPRITMGRMNDRQWVELGRALRARSTKLHVSCVLDDTLAVAEAFHAASCITSLAVRASSGSYLLLAQNLQQLLPVCPHLTSLELKGDAIVRDPAVWDSLSSCPRLASLALSPGIRIDSPAADNARAHLAQLCPHVTSLTLDPSQSGQVGLLEAVGPQLLHLTLNSDSALPPRDMHPPRDLHPMRRLTSIMINCDVDQPILNALVSLPALTHVTLGRNPAITTSHASTPCAWRYLALLEPCKLEELGKLPLRQLDRLQMAGISLSLCASGAAFDQQVAALAGCLGQPAALEWGAGVPALALPCRPAEDVKERLGRLGPLQPFLGGRAALRLDGKTLMSADLRAFNITSFNGSLTEFCYLDGPLSPTCWVELPRLLPRLHTLSLSHVDFTELAVMAAGFRGPPLQLVLRGATPWVVQRAAGLLHSFASWGVTPQITIWDDKGNKLQPEPMPADGLYAEMYGLSETETEGIYDDGDDFGDDDDDFDDHDHDVDWDGEGDWDGGEEDDAEEWDAEYGYGM